MTDKIVVSLGGSSNLARITKVTHCTWPQFIQFLKKEPRVTEDKASAGWFCPAEFKFNNRDGDSLLARYALTFDYDNITPEDLWQIRKIYECYEHVIYTTASHTPENPRVRIIFPLSRPVDHEEFRCVTRTIGDLFNLTKLAPESDKPAQMVFRPTRAPAGEYWCQHNKRGSVIDVDHVLKRYENWRDRSQWPLREGESLSSEPGVGESPDEKLGIVGEFCRAYRVPEAIERFGLPYTRGSTDTRYTYDEGSRPDGLRIYDDGLKSHSDHATDPANGQTNAFDLVRLHKYGKLDTEDDLDQPITERPSYREMTRFAMELPEIRQALVAREFSNLDDDLPPPEKKVKTLAVPLEDLLQNPTRPRWLIRNELERGVIALMAGPRGTYKSFIALDWALRTVMRNLGPVYVLSAEGADFDRRATAWLKTFAPGWTAGEKPAGLYVAQARIDLNQHDNIELVRQDCINKHNIRPVLFVLDTFSKLSGALDENSNTDVKAFIGRLDNGLKRPFDATVLMVTHTGHGEKTRARGASALEADTDAAYVVSRHNGPNNLVSLSRERFKSSPELDPLTLRPEIVTLGYKDDEGELVSSIVLYPDNTPTQPTRSEPKGLYAQSVWQAAHETLKQGPRTVRFLVDYAANKLTPPEGRDTRRQNCSRAVQKLVVEGFLHKHANDHVSLTTAVAVDEEDWMDE